MTPPRRSASHHFTTKEEFDRLGTTVLIVDEEQSFSVSAYKRQFVTSSLERLFAPVTNNLRAIKSQT